MVSLDYKLFHYINSVYFRLPRELSTVREAVAYIGIDKLKNFAILLTLTNITSNFTELIFTGLIRARMCEIIAEQTHQEEPSQLFTAGLFSILEPLLKIPLQEIVERLR